ncbi:MAG: glycosyltransferase [Thermoguttaceae bacterium]
MSIIQTYERAKQWIDRYSNFNGGIAVSSGNRTSYPEVSGYYIPTLLNWGMKDRALRYARWLVTIQNEDGSWNAPDGKNPYVFDTGQILRGMYALVDEYPEFKSSLLKGCDWIKSRQLESGRITTPDTSAWGGVPEAVHLYAIAPLLWTAKKFNRPDLRVVVDNALDYYVKQEKTFPYQCLSHFHAYMLDGLLELGREDIVLNAMQEVAALQRKDGSVPGLPKQSGVCSTGLFQYAIIWYKLGERDRADHAFAHACSLQNESGGWFGSYGQCDNYFSDAEIAWAIKYFLDALTLKLQTNFVAIFDSFLASLPDNDGRYELVRDSLPKQSGAKILDCGCGKGRYVNRLHADFPNLEWHAMDLAPSFTPFINDGIKTAVGSIVKTPYPDNHFDCVYLAEVLEHCVDLDAAVAELYRITKPDGNVLIIDKNIAKLGTLKICDWEQWFSSKQLSHKFQHLGCDVSTHENIPYENKDGKDGLFLGWKVFKKLPDINSPVVSIVLPVYNGAKYLRESIESCLLQTFKRWELIIVNDCSTDESPKIAEYYAAQDARIRVIHNTTNLKLPESLNVGFRNSKGKYLTWTSDDNRYHSTALQKMVEFLDEKTEFGMVRARYDCIDEVGNGKECQWWQSSLPNLLTGNFFGACFLYRRLVMETIGEYDVAWFLVEDYEYWLRASCQHRIGSISEVLYSYRIHDQTLTAMRQNEVHRKDLEVRQKYWGTLQNSLTHKERYNALKSMFYKVTLLDEETKVRFAENSSFSKQDKRLIQWIVFEETPLGMRLKRLLASVNRRIKKVREFFDFHR